MSRLIVKNLPLKISQEDIKKHFSVKGNITDVKLIYKDGEFRRYGFVGFEKDDDARKACKYFNNTFIRQAKINVEICQELKGDQKPTSWREKNKLRKDAEKEAARDAKTSEEDKKSKKGDKKKKEGSKGNEGSVDQIPVNSGENENADANDKENDEDADEKVADKTDVSDLDYLKSLKVTSKTDDSPTKPQKKALRLLENHFQVVVRTTERCKIRQKGSLAFTRQSIKDFLKPLKFKSLRIPPKTKYVAYVGFKTEKLMRRALQKDKSFLNGARIQVTQYKEAVNKDGSEKANAPWEVAEQKLKTAEPVGETGRIFVRNLWYSVTEDDIRELFEKYGQVTDIILPICKLTRRAKGFAIVTFMFPEHSVHAMTELDGSTFKGRVLHILPAKDEEDENKEKEGESFKDKKNREQKATAGSWHNWNSLFLGSGAVIDLMSEKYNKSKQEILNAEGKQSVAVNLALGESQIVDETRRFLEENEIALDAFTNPGIQRSSTVILVKNLPANTTAQELSSTFSRFGELGRVVLPPSGVTGIVEYLDPGEAKKGFRSLAYSRFRYLPLYLEWAPQRIFKTEFVSELKMEPTEEKFKEQNEGEDSDQETGNATEKHEKSTNNLPDPEEGTTIYVKNLNFTTTEEALKNHFKRIGTVHSVLLAKKRGLSQGYGFVQFVRQSDAQKALREMPETLLEERYIQLKLSEKTLVTSVKSSRIMHSQGLQTSTKILVKNIPFEATSKEVRQLFATFGDLKSVRLPNKPGTYEHRGFGFVDFVTREEAKKAFEALCLSTHLYDRRLVLEWAKDDETVDELRKRTADQFLSGRGTPLKKRRIADTLEANAGQDGED